jgi:hypothetical protein
MIFFVSASASAERPSMAITLALACAKDAANACQVTVRVALFRNSSNPPIAQVLESLL